MVYGRTPKSWFLVYVEGLGAIPPLCFVISVESLDRRVGVDLLKNPQIAKRLVLWFVVSVCKGVSSNLW